MDRYTQKRPLEDAVVYPPQQEYRARHVEPEEEETEREEEESASVKIASGLETGMIVICAGNQLLPPHAVSIRQRLSPDYFHQFTRISIVLSSK